jgi:hypothetical protein
MLTPEQIYRRALNRYPEFLQSLSTGSPFFPLNVFGGGLAKPKDFVADRAGIQLLQSQSKAQTGFGYELTWEERTFRRFGTQNVPATVSFATQDDYLRFIKKQDEVRQFLEDLQQVRKICPELNEWTRGRPLQVVAHAGNWDGLLKVCAYLRSNPRPNCYLRELPVVMDTKFVERHKGILSELLPIAAPQTVGPDISSFELRFGFRLSHPLLRLRFLDRLLAARFGFPFDDFATPCDVAAKFPFNNVSVIVVENKMTFLTLPPLPGVLAIFGSGDAASLLANIGWLASCRLYYWGDLDSHGFEILSNLRGTFCHTVSVLMDEHTLAAHDGFVVKASRTRSKELLRLKTDEAALYDRLVSTETLLEQERIHGEFSTQRLKVALQC